MTKVEAIKIAKKIAEHLTKFVPKFKMRLYGSYARDEANSDSDIDIFIEVPKQYISLDLKEKVFDITWEVSFRNEILIQTSIFSDEEIWNTPRRSSPFIQAVMREGILI